MIWPMSMTGSMPSPDTSTVEERRPESQRIGRFESRQHFSNAPLIRLFNVYYSTRTVLLLLCEMVLVASSFLVATAVTLGRDADIALYDEHGLLKILGITVVIILLSYYFDLYEPNIVSTSSEIYFRLLLVLGCSCFALAAALYLQPSMLVAPHVYSIGFALLVPALLAWRKVQKRLMTRSFNTECAYVLGSGVQARSIVHILEQRPDVGIKLIGWQDEERSPAQDRERWAEDLNDLARSSQAVDRIIIAVDDARKGLPIPELLTLRFQGVSIETAAALRERLTGKIALDGLLPSSFLYTEGFRVRPSQQFTRVLVSQLAAIVGLLIVLPFFPGIALVIKLSSKGPIFFRQTRVGLNGKHFKVVKFRTMATDAEANGAQWASKNDSRVTPVGRFMRKTRIDEIPQLWNVVRRDMGFVGPRPERPEFTSWLSQELEFYYLRHLIRPGLTGWAQVRYGYGSTLEETRQKLEYDLYYIKHMSLGMDLTIMFETVKTILRRRGAQ